VKADDINESLKDRLWAYANSGDARAWLDRAWPRVEALFTNVRLRDFVFEPIKDIFAVHGKDPADGIRSVITRVAVANAVLAGLPGKMGVGVLVSIGLEAWMAYQVARLVGLDIQKPADVWKYLGLLAASAGMILFGIKALLGIWFSVFSAVIPGINPMIFAELFVTNFVGVLFWIGFEEARSTGGFQIPSRAFKRGWDETKSLFQYQYEILKRNLTPANLASMAGRARAWLTGEIPLGRKTQRGEVMATVATACLLAGQYGRLEGPLGREFIGAIRDRYPDLADASVDEIADHMRQYSGEQLVGVTNLIKGKLFERLVARYENQDNDAWKAYLHEDESYPGSDLTLRNEDTGDVLEISLKASDDPSYIEHALARYPDVPILTTEEVGAAFVDNPDVSPHPLSNEDLTEITEDNFDALLDAVSPVTGVLVAAGGVSAGAAARLWPFTAAYLRGRIRYEQLRKAFERILGESGVPLAARVSYGLVLGPVFAWYLLARGVIGLTNAAERKVGVVRRLAARGTLAQVTSHPTARPSGAGGRA
jgi:hypothetical protein